MTKFLKYIKKLIPKKNCKVSVFIIGAQKAGTSALHEYLGQHPQIVRGIKKEINFFNHKENYSKGEKWYHSQFHFPLFFQKKTFLLDSTPQYLNNEGVAERIYNYNSDSYIIVLLRNPVERAYSAWNMYKQLSETSEKDKKKILAKHISLEKKEKFKTLLSLNPFPDFKDFVERELAGKLDHPKIIERGIYVNQLLPYYNLFPPSKIKVIESKDFKCNSLHYLNSIFKDLGLKQFEKFDAKPVHERQYKNPIDNEIEEMLENYYKPYNAELFKLIKQEFNW